MKELIIQGIIGILVAGGAIGWAVKEIRKLAESTETKLDDKALDLLPPAVKAIKNGLKRAGYDNKQVMKILAEIRQEYIEQEEKTDGKVIDELKRKEKEIDTGE